jgi:hypothetical protein
MIPSTQAAEKAAAIVVSSGYSCMRGAGSLPFVELDSRLPQDFLIRAGALAALCRGIS